MPSSPPLASEAGRVGGGWPGAPAGGAPRPPAMPPRAADVVTGSLPSRRPHMLRFAWTKAPRAAPLAASRAPALARRSAVARVLRRAVAGRAKAGVGGRPLGWLPGPARPGWAGLDRLGGAGNRLAAADRRRRRVAPHGAAARCVPCVACAARGPVPYSPSGARRPGMERAARSRAGGGRALRAARTARGFLPAWRLPFSPGGGASVGRPRLRRPVCPRPICCADAGLSRTVRRDDGMIADDINTMSFTTLLSAQIAEW